MKRYQEDRIEGARTAIFMLEKEEATLDMIFEEGAEILATYGKDGKDISDGVYAILTLMDSEKFPPTYEIKE